MPKQPPLVTLDLNAPYRLVYNDGKNVAQKKVVADPKLLAALSGLAISCGHTKDDPLIIHHMGIYNYRPTRQNPNKLSDHATAQAIDICGLESAHDALQFVGKGTEEQELALEAGWIKPLRQFFKHVVTRHDNALHRDHWHCSVKP